nr:uncharacterized protein LOC107429717 isoform X2 [Ziziphus jujuba var. spinosa]
MGKLLCDSPVAEKFQTQSSPSVSWIDPPPAAVDAIEAVDLVDHNELVATTMTWDTVLGLEDQQRRNLQRLHAKGVLWTRPEDDDSSSQQRSVVFKLSHGGEVSADGNCLFTASQKAMMGTSAREIDARDLRRRTVARFLQDFGSAKMEEKEAINRAIGNMYAPDLRNGWGVHVVQEVKLLARKEDRASLDSAIDELVHLGMQRELAAESIYKERCITVEDGPSWAKYMSISGSPEDEYDIVTLQYTEEGLLSIDENRYGHAAAFGDDIAIECLATEFKREIYVSLVIDLRFRHMDQMQWLMKIIVYSFCLIAQGVKFANLLSSFS